MSPEKRRKLDREAEKIRLVSRIKEARNRLFYAEENVEFARDDLERLEKEHRLLCLHGPPEPNPSPGQSPGALAGERASCNAGSGGENIAATRGDATAARGTLEGHVA